MKRAGNTAPACPFGSLKWGKGAIHDEFSMPMPVRHTISDRLAKIFFGSGMLRRSKELLRAGGLGRQVYSRTRVRPSPGSISGALQPVPAERNLLFAGGVMAGPGPVRVFP